MTPHWTEQREALREWLVSHPRILIGCDFDGTLAPMVSHADQVRLPVATKTVLQRLIARPDVRLAFISGRSLADLQKRVDLGGVLYAGNHGLEMTDADGSISLAPAASEAAAALSQVLAVLEPAIKHLPGVWIENKQLTLSVHYRLADESCYPEVEHQVRSAVRDMASLVVRPARRIWEIRPAIDWDKGSALRRFMDEHQVPSSAAAFLGDDVTDVDAFRELPDGWTFSVGEHVRSNARVSVHDPLDCAALLEWMADVRAGR